MQIKYLLVSNGLAGPQPPAVSPYTENQMEEKTEVACEFRVSEQCKGTHQISRKAEAKNRQRNNGKYICLYCSRKVKYSGSKNPNIKYHKNHSYFKEIDSEYKAYALGLIASDGTLSKGGFTIELQTSDRLLLKNLAEKCGWSEKVKDGHITGYRKDGSPVEMSKLSISSQEMSLDICRHLRIQPGKKSHTVTFPDLADDLRKHFLRGLFDGDGFVLNIKPSLQQRWPRPRCGISSSSDKMRNEIIKLFGAYYVGGENLYWDGAAAIDIMSLMYDGAKIYLERKKTRYQNWSIWVPGLLGHYGSGPMFRYCKTRKDAHPPSKSRASDSGYDLVLLSKIKDFNSVTSLYDTCIKVQPIDGWYFDLVPRSSLAKCGYTLANCIGVIDRTYVGTVMAALTKVDSSAPDLPLPGRYVQIIPRPIIHVEFELVESFDETARGAGGFGSTGR